MRSIHWCSWVGRGTVREQWLAEEWKRVALSGLYSKPLWAQSIMPIGEPVSLPHRCLTLNITPGSDWHLISLYITTTESDSKVVRTQKMITYSRNSWLFYTTSLSIPFQMYREQYEELYTGFRVQKVNAFETRQSIHRIIRLLGSVVDFM